MIEEIISQVNLKETSDIHITTDNPVMVRIDGDIIKVNPDAQSLNEHEVMAIIHSMMSEKQKKEFAERLEYDFSYQSKNGMRFRVNAFSNVNGPAAALRLIPTEIKGFEDLNLPDLLKPLCHSDKGLILVVGPTGSGKSTTLAALIDYINQTQKCNIITIEDPIEFLHKSKTSLMNQREVGKNTHSFANALRGALREDPDVILVSELRDIETIRMALTAAETGHLVFATVHTNSAAQTVNRIVDVFPAEDKVLARTMLASSIKAVISQRLVKKLGGGRCMALEIMIANPSIRNLIREDKIHQINSIIELSRKNGMNLMKDAINELLTKKLISAEVAEDAIKSSE